MAGRFGGLVQLEAAGKVTHDKTFLQLDISPSRLRLVVEEHSWRFNRYGLLRPEHIPMIMSEANVEGEVPVLSAF